MNRKEKTVSIQDTFHGKEVWLDSIEEWQFYNWVLEAVGLGLVKDFEYQPPSFELTPKYTYQPLFEKKEKPLFREHIFTADFKLLIDYENGRKFSNVFKISKECLSEDRKTITVYIDTKGAYSMNGLARAFSINQKLMWKQNKIYINKVVPKEFFKTMGCPERCRYSFKTKKASHVFDACPNIKDAVFKN